MSCGNKGKNKYGGGKGQFKCWVSIVPQLLNGALAFYKKFCLKSFFFFEVFQTRYIKTKSDQYISSTKKIVIMRTGV